MVSGPALTFFGWEGTDSILRMEQGKKGNRKCLRCLV